MIDPDFPSPALDQVLRLELPVVVRLGGRLMALSDVRNWMAGSIIELTKKADSELDLMINNKAVGAGLAVKVGENFGIRLTYVGDLRKRIEAMDEGQAYRDAEELANKPVAAPAL